MYIHLHQTFVSYARRIPVSCQEKLRQLRHLLVIHMGQNPAAWIKAVRIRGMLEISALLDTHTTAPLWSRMIQSFRIHGPKGFIAPTFQGPKTVVFKGWLKGTEILLWTFEGKTLGDRISVSLHVCMMLHVHLFQCILLYDAVNGCKNIRL